MRRRKSELLSFKPVAASPTTRDLFSIQQPSVSFCGFFGTRFTPKEYKDTYELV
jgi:hypothetical protein